MVLHGLAQALFHLRVVHVHGHVLVAAAQFVLDVHAQVAGENDDRLGEIHRVALAVGEAAVLQDLQKLVQNGGMGLLDLVKQHDGEGVLLDGVGQLAAGLVADVAGRRAHQLLIGVGLAVLGHVKADAGAFVAEKLLGQGLGGLGFANAGGACVEQHALGLGRGGGTEAVHARHGALDHVQSALQGGVLALDALFKVLLGGAEALHGQVLPRIFLDAVLVQVNNAAQIADGRLLPLGQTAHGVQLGEGQAFG